MKKHALRLQRVFFVWSVPAAREHSERVIERRAAFSEPGTFSTSVCPLIPATARESIARGVDFSPSTHMATGMARISRSSTASVASGVTSCGERPVPPVVTTRSACNMSQAWTMAAEICPSSSGTVCIACTAKPAFSSMARMAGPLVSVRVPAAQKSLTVRMTA